MADGTWAGSSAGTLPCRRCCTIQPSLATHQCSLLYAQNGPYRSFTRSSITNLVLGVGQLHIGRLARAVGARKSAGAPGRPRLDAVGVEPACMGTRLSAMAVLNPGDRNTRVTPP